MNPLDIVLAGLFEMLGIDNPSTSQTPKAPKLDGSQKFDAKGQTRTTSNSGNLRNFNNPGQSASRAPSLDPISNRSGLQATPPNRPPGGFGQAPGQLSFDPNIKPGQVTSRTPSVPPKLEAGAAGRAEKRLIDLKTKVKNNGGKAFTRSLQFLTLLGVKPNYDKAIEDGYSENEAFTQALAAALVGAGSAKATSGGGKLQTAAGLLGSVFGDDAAIGLVRMMQDANEEALVNQQNNDTAMFALRRALNQELKKRLGFSLPDPPEIKTGADAAKPKTKPQQEIPTAPTNPTGAQLGEYTPNNYPNQSQDPRILNSPELRKQLGIMMQQVTPIQKPITNPNKAPIRAKLKPLDNLNLETVSPTTLRPELYQ